MHDTQSIYERHASVQPEPVPDSHGERQKRWEDGAADRRFDAAARALRDSLFDDVPEVIEAIQAARSASQRLSLLSQPGRRSEAVSLVAALEAELNAASVDWRNAAIDDGLAGDADFSRALQVSERVEQLRLRLDAARAACEALTRSPQQMGEFAEDARAKECHLRDLLLMLKRQYLEAHPELLGDA